MTMALDIITMTKGAIIMRTHKASDCNKNKENTGIPIRKNKMLFVINPK
jgi:hypothetical protein